MRRETIISISMIIIITKTAYPVHQAKVIQALPLCRHDAMPSMTAIGQGRRNQTKQKQKV
jgi:hypothetical protein